MRAFYYLILLLSCKAFSQSKEPKPFILGVIDELYSKELSENRILNIYLPEGYDKSGAERYPVTYLLDGSADEDFIHVTGLYQFCSFEWVNQAPKSIVVGIATVDRRRDFTFPTTIGSDREKYPTSGQSDKFIAFIEKELQPYIEKNYKAAAARTLIGQSLGGLLATEILLTKPHLFNNYIIISPSIWWDNGSILDKPAIQPAISTQVYIGVGDEGPTPTAIPRIMQDDAKLLAEKLMKIKNIKVYFDYLPKENHATIAHQAIMNALKMIYRK